MGFVVVLLTLMTRALLFSNEWQNVILEGVISLAALVVNVYVPL